MTTRADKRPVSRRNREAEKRRIIMKKTIVSLLLVLSLFLSVFALASCGKRGEAADETTADNGATNPASDGGAGETDEATAAATTDKWETLAKKITMIAARDRQLKFEFSSNHSAEKTSKNDIYLKGPDAIEVDVTPLIQQMVYERNRTANELLGTTIDYVFWDYAWGSQAEQIDLVVKGNASDAPDLFVNMLNELNRELVNGTFKDVWSIPGSFFDFSTPGWLDTWMKTLSFTGDRAYILGSDYFLDVFRAIPLLPFNMTMMDKSAEKLAPAILPEGETLGAGEELTPYFFDLVDKGGWTWDVLGKICEASWVDSDGDGADSVNDTLGIIADEFGDGGQCAGSFIYSCGETLTEAYPIEDPTSEYNNKQWIKYADTSEGLNAIFDAVKAVFEGPGSFSTSYTFSGNTPEKPGIAYHQIKFAAGETLFAGVQLLGALEDDVFQQMEDLYSVVPCPKTDASKEYNTIIYSTGDAGAINVNANPRKSRALSAYIQHCTENSPAIRDQFLQIVTKYKTTVYNQGTDRMLNIIYKAIRYGRDKTVDDLIGTSADRWHGFMRRERFLAGSEYISTQYASYVPVKQKRLDKTMEKWYGLPKVEDNAE